MARTASCLVPPRVEPAGLFSGFEGLFARLLGRANLVFVGVLLCDMLDPFRLRRHAAITEALQWHHCQRGRIPDGGHPALISARRQ